MHHALLVSSPSHLGRAAHLTVKKVDVLHGTASGALVDTVRYRPPGVAPGNLDLDAELTDHHIWKRLAPGLVIYLKGKWPDESVDHFANPSFKGLGRVVLTSSPSVRRQQESGFRQDFFEVLDLHADGWSEGLTNSEPTCHRKVAHARREAK